MAVALGNTSADELEKLGTYGVSKVLHVNDSKLNNFTSKAYTKAIATLADHLHADDIVFANNSTGRTLAPRVAVKLKASLLAGVSALPEKDGTFIKTVYSGKAFTFIKPLSVKRVISLNPNSVKPVIKQSAIIVESVNIEFLDTDFDYKVVSVKSESDGHIPLPEADLVVSAGRGMKGPENWGIIEELAQAMGATTACSRPVADIGWRPHHEHVGQT
ncbi:MAG: electron transfer flavoprotein subunit alpha/FixB family protein, partial [Chitinophagales bacterium]